MGAAQRLPGRTLLRLRQPQDACGQFPPRIFLCKATRYSMISCRSGVAGLGPRPHTANRTTTILTDKNNGRKSPKSAGHLPEPRAQEQDAAHHLPDEWREAARRRDLVRQLLRFAASRRPLAIGVQARHIHHHAGPARAPDGDRPRRGSRVNRDSHFDRRSQVRAGPKPDRGRAPVERRPPPVRAVVLVPCGRRSGPLGRPGSGGARSAPGSGKTRAAHAIEDRLAEAAGLARAIQLDVVAEEIVPLPQPRPATLFGSGKVAELGTLIGEREATLAIVDHALSPVQQRNLEKAWGCKVLDRTGLILEIFGQRARTREGRLQVELAHLTYQKSRLVRTWTHLERQRGGFGFLGGPGEAQIETDRRLIDERIAAIRKELGVVVKTRSAAPRRPQQGADPGGGAGGLHQRRQVHAVQPGDGRRGLRQGPGVRDARPDHARAEAAWWPPRHPVRHRGLHLRPADPAGGGLPRHPGGGGGRRPDAARARHQPPRHRGPAPRRGERC